MLLGRVRARVSLAVPQWVMQSMNPVEKKEVKQKSLKALEKLGHKSLVLDEYESASVCCSIVD